jgi:hypothetical protein
MVTWNHWPLSHQKLSWGSSLDDKAGFCCLDSARRSAGPSFRRDDYSVACEQSRKETARLYWRSEEESCRAFFVHTQYGTEIGGMPCAQDLRLSHLELYHIEPNNTLKVFPIPQIQVWR